MRAISESCQGESHRKAGNRPCQDFCYAWAEGRNALGIVSDGHGGARYFRSETGSRLAAEVTREGVRDVIKSTDEALFRDEPLTERKALTAGPVTPDKRDIRLRELFAPPVRNWHSAIARHAEENPVTGAEREKVRPEYINAFMSRDGSGRRTGLAETYGCTLICFARTASYWLAFQIGDGKCIAFSPDGNWSEPVPWDDEGCFLNSTTSLCNEGAVDEFRYCYGGKDTFPAAVFLGSDGLDGSFGEPGDLANFYANILKLIGRSSREEADRELKETLPELSRMGSQDDMSVACCYDEGALGPAIRHIIGWQLGNIMAGRDRLLRRISALKDRISSYSGRPDLTPKEESDRAHCENELEQLNVEMKTLEEGYSSLMAEREAAGVQPAGAPRPNPAVMDGAGAKAAAEPNPAVRAGIVPGHGAAPDPAPGPAAPARMADALSSKPRDTGGSAESVEPERAKAADGAARGRSLILSAELIFIVLVFAGAALFIRSYLGRNEGENGAAPSSVSASGSAAAAESGEEAGGYNSACMARGGVPGLVLETGIFRMEGNDGTLRGGMRQQADQAMPAVKSYLDVISGGAGFCVPPAEDNASHGTCRYILIDCGDSTVDESGILGQGLPADGSVQDAGGAE